MNGRSGIYVEIFIRGDIDDVWRYTQTPELHKRWDLRFTTIQYHPRASEADPQRFSYSTRIGFGLKITGDGESTGNNNSATGSRTSALKFWSTDSRSLIEEGSGYWQYIPAKGGVRFLTWYDYRTRFGQIGRFLDRPFFRPLLGWATAWSFDRLRLKIEKNVEPEIALQFWLIHAFSRVAIGLIWFWQGLVPKLLLSNADEKAMIAASHLSSGAVPVIGWIEIAIAATAFLTWKNPLFFIFNVFAMIAALAVVAATAPSYLGAAFNPVTLNLAMIALSAVGYVASDDLPYASSCFRQPRQEPE